jgi:hypothetical protein
MLSYRHSPRILIAFSSVALVICSIPVFGTRFLNDMDFYSLFADKLAAGGVLYRDAMDTKPPLVFLHYALIFKIFGLDNVTAVKVVTMGWLGMSAAVMAMLRKALSPGTATPLLAAPLFILASFSGWGEDFLSSNTELLSNLFIVTGVWLLARRDFAPWPPALVTGGACIGIAFLYRYHSAAALAAYAATILLCRRRFDRKLMRLLLVGAGFALPSLVFVAHHARLGTLSDLRLMLSLQAHYAHDADDFYWPTMLRRLLVAVSGLWPVVILAVLQAIAILRKRAAAPRSEIFQLMFAAWSVAGFFAGGRWFPPYFVQAIPGLILLAAARLDAPLKDPAESPKRRRLEAYAFPTIVAVALVFTLVNGIYYWTRKPALPIRDLVAFVNEHSRPRDEVLLWTWRPQLLFETGRFFATRMLVNSPLIGQLEPPPRTSRPRLRRSGLPELWPAFLRDLAVARPKLLVDDPPGRSEWRMERYPQLASILAEYRPCEVLDDVCVYVRKD